MRNGKKISKCNNTKKTSTIIELPIVACYCGINRVIFPINLINESRAIVL